ncbi:hypothetical protein KGA66_14405 [Actinocrinis puniceicyclus]|uniref:site-specific DNA-methyltransferase (adenine-specific) n=1 Tax=Actinocrinis puniceicyclus TaxID=977794 RepID=A0A8J7WMV6_9ACTN|nr:type IIL restriction-modification enzyme MmeI [Actinocrinis puniceicyclus]MBS2964248.1 hypothetical protein [Actinocrinis puniceicyclus]
MAARMAMTRTKRAVRTEQSPADQHAEWLGLLRPDGPFLSVSVLTRADAYPQGLDKLDTERTARIRQAWAEVQQDPYGLCSAWQELVLGELLGWRGQVWRDGVPGGLGGLGAAGVNVAGFHGEGALRPNGVLVGPPTPGGGESGPQERVLVYRLPWPEGARTRLDKPARHQSVSAIDQAAALCRARRVPLALLTNGREFVLVHARASQPVSVARFDPDLWLEEPLLLRAFVTLLRPERAALPERDARGEFTGSLAALIARTAEDTVEVTNTLGKQVLLAVELLTGELSRLDREAGLKLLVQVEPPAVYRAALTVMLRAVFLLYAEEQRLLPIDDPLYQESYAVGSLYEQLHESRSREGAEIGDRQAAAWPRLLALFRAIHDGCMHPDLRIPAYGGSLFDPGEFPWLEPMQVTDRVVYRILDALLMLRIDKNGRRRDTPERLSYKGLDVEQIGHVYEGLLEFSCLRAQEPYLGFMGKNEPEIPLSKVLSWQQSALEQELKAALGATDTQVAKGLTRPVAEIEYANLHAACDNDAQLAETVKPFHGLLRTDLRGLPTVFPTGSLVITQVGDRRNTGTHYTPRSLAEEVVKYTLEPLCYRPGPADGVPAALGNVLPGEQLLKLRVLDPAMGSGAFLVSACRYLSERVVEAWERDGRPEDLAGVEDRDLLLLAARRMVVDRCLYGVDRDPMAVSLGKLSLWLVTLAKGRPFSFVDHALRCGDSLVGTITAEQITAFHLDPSRQMVQNDVLINLLQERAAPLFSRAAELRREIESMPDNDIRDADAKAKLLAEAEGLTDQLRLVADAVVGAALSTAEQKSDDAYDDRLAGLAPKLADALSGDSAADDAVRRVVDGWLKGPASGPRKEPIRPLHWALEFPEVLGTSSGSRPEKAFDAVVGNPPFVGGQKITGSNGDDYRDYLVARLAGGVRGSADLCSYFLLRNAAAAPRGRIGIIATNTIAQGDTREVGLDQLDGRAFPVYRAVKSQKWPGTANVSVSLLWCGQPGESEQCFLDRQPVVSIAPTLDPASRATGNPERLARNADTAFQGSNLVGIGFVLEPDEAASLLTADPRNKEVVFPYLNGDDLNSRPDCSPSRWVIDFNDWDESRAARYTRPFEVVVERVKPIRDKNAREQRRRYWWRHGEVAPALRKAIEGLERVIVISLVSKYGAIAMVPTGTVFSHMLGVFASDDAAFFALLSSAFHFAWWTEKGNSTLETRLRYTPSDGFETFAQPNLTDELRDLGTRLHEFRSATMLDRNLGLTKLYNEFHDRANQDPDIVELRAIHKLIDEAVFRAYQQTPDCADWADLDLNHDFHVTTHGLRYTIDPAAQVEILDRLLELNQSRYAEEVRLGLHDKKKSSAKRAASPRATAAPTVPGLSTQMSLIPGSDDDRLF